MAKLKWIIAPDAQGNPVRYEVDGIDASSATAGQVLTADGAGGWQWGDVQGGSEGAGWKIEEVNLLEAILRNAYYKTDQSTNITNLISALSNIDSITLSESSGSLREGNSLTITATVTGSGTLSAVSSNTSIATVAVSGTSITITAHAEGSATITATYGTARATYALTVLSGQITMYTITNDLNNVTNSNMANSVEENEAYSATLTVPNGYNFDSVTVTMGGVDVTATAYSEGYILIASVTGDIVITASASQPVIINTIQKQAGHSIVYYSGGVGSDVAVTKNYGKYIRSVPCFAQSTVVTVTITNETDSNITVGSIYGGSVLVTRSPQYSGRLYVYESSVVLNRTSALTPGESATFTVTTAPNSYCAVQCIDNLTYSFSGNYTEYTGASSSSITIATSKPTTTKIYSDAGETLASTLNYIDRYASTDVLETDTDVTVTIITGNSDVTNTAWFGSLVSGSTDVHYGVQPVSGNLVCYANSIFEYTFTVHAGYKAMCKYAGLSSQTIYFN